MVKPPGMPYHQGAGMARHLLTDVQVRNAKPQAAPYRLSDGDNLYLFIASTGAKSWQFRYRLDRAQQTYTIGRYPNVTLEFARKEADRARAQVEAGHHLTIRKRTEKLERDTRRSETFEKIAAAWLDAESKEKNWTPAYRIEVEASLRNHAHRLNALKVSEITARHVATIIRGMRHTAPLMLDKVHRRLMAIMDFAAEEGLIARNPLSRRRPRVKRPNYPAVTDLQGIGEILRNARAADPCKGIERAHVLLAFGAQRVSEIVGAKWEEFDLEAATWSIPRERMKRKDAERGPHIIPLPVALVAQLREWRTADGEDAVYVCPAPREASKPITPEGIEKFYRRSLNLAGKHSPHSWRSAFSTICRNAGEAGDVVEAQLDHQIGTKVASAYDRAARLELRRELVQWYENTLVSARDGAQIMPLKRSK